MDTGSRRFRLDAPSAARHRRRRHRWRRHRWLRLFITLVVVLGLVIAGVTWVRLHARPPAPTLQAALPMSLRAVPDPHGGAVQWPHEGGAEVMVPGVITLGPVGDTGAVPIASLTKVMTSLVLLDDYPLDPGEQGPTLTVSDTDVFRYMVEKAADYSVVPVTAGEQLTEYQVLEAMLLPSADNVAEMAAQWIDGSQDAFVGEMNAQAQQWGLASTHFADVSGLSSGSVSSVPDLVALAQRAMANPVLAGVVALPSISLPGVHGPISTYNYVLGEDGIVGIKTGNSSAAGGCFLFAAQVTVAGSRQLAYGAVLGQRSGSSTLDQALQAGLSVVQGLERVLGGVTLIADGERLGILASTWGSAIPLLATGAIDLMAPPGTPVRAVVRFADLRRTTSLPARSPVGTLAVTVDGRTYHTTLVTAGALRAPTVWWRLWHL